jgi:hypothetical protein
MVMAPDADAAHAKAVSEFSRERSHVSVIGVELYADDEHDEVVGGFDKKGSLPRSNEPPNVGTQQPRLTT